MTSEKIGTLLIHHGKITSADLALALSVQAAMERSERIGRVLCHYDLLSDEALLEALAHQSGWPVFEGELVPDGNMASLLGKTFLQEHGVCPVAGEEGVLFVSSDPYDVSVADHIMAAGIVEPRFRLASARRIAEALSGISDDKRSPQGEGGRSTADMAMALLNEAVGSGASDIHIEPSSTAVEVRFRVDGVLRFHRAFPLRDNPVLVNVFFNRAEISAGDFLRFHDARFEHVCGNKKVDVRLSHIPSVNGSSLVLRLLDKARSAVSLRELGYAQDHLRVIERALGRPHGIILLTGPTGCGKTTSLYAMLRHVRHAGVKAVSVEDPVEVCLPLVTQVPADLKKGHDFSQVTRAFLRHDPDIIMIGEIRDEKTAAEAVRAAITGHRVFSTLHTNDALTAILRLRDLGVDYSYIAGTLACVVAQRLVRCLCRHCRQEECVTPASLPENERVFISSPGQVVYRALKEGCSHCFAGYSGRTVVAETLFIDDETRFMIEQGFVHEIAVRTKERGAAAGMRADAARLVREGITSTEEAARVVG